MLDFKKELKKLSEEKIDSTFIKEQEKTYTNFQFLNQNINKLFKKQSEMSMQVEEVYSIVEEKDLSKQIKAMELENIKTLKSLIVSADLIEDFYVYYKTNLDESLSGQSQIMWNTIYKEMTSLGLTRIEDENTPFDPTLNSIEKTVNDNSLQDGFIKEVIKSGYMYKGVVFRKSSVIVNKLGGTANE